MKTLLPILKTKLFLLSFISACTVILATTVPQIRNFIAPEKKIGEKITTEQKKIPPKINRQNKIVNASSVTSGFSLEVNNSYYATVVTDKGDYSPGEHVIITGTGWNPGETVTLHIVSDCGCTNETLEAVAGPDGTIYNAEFLIQEWHIGSLFSLTATGLISQQVAQTTFTDGLAFSVSITPTTSCPSTSVTYQIDITNNSTTPGNTDLGSGRIQIPSGYTGIPVAGTVLTYSTSPVAKTWDVRIGTGVNSDKIIFSSDQTSDNLSTGQTLTIFITVTSPSVSGSYEWTTTAFRGRNFSTDPYPVPVPQPTVLVDATSPTIATGGTTTTLGCNPSAGDINSALGTATATDAVSTPTVSSSDGSVSSNGCARSQTRTFTARDACNNTSSAFRTVTWTADNTPPGFTGSYADVNLGCNPANPSGSLGTATATDACGAVTITSTDGSVASNGCNRSITRTFTAEDGCHNSSTASRTVRWMEDNTPPEFTGSYADVNL